MWCVLLCGSRVWLWKAREYHECVEGVEDVEGVEGVDVILKEYQSLVVWLKSDWEDVRVKWTLKKWFTVGCK